MAAANPNGEDIRRIRDALPALDSTDFRDLLKGATPATLPAEVLAWAYRQLIDAKQDGLADRVLSCLFSDRRGYLEPVSRAARVLRRQKRRDIDTGDLEVQAMREIIARLQKGKQGEHATESWPRFCFQRVQDAARVLYGRGREPPEHTVLPEELEAEESQDETGLIATVYGMGEGGQAERARVLQFIREQSAKWPDPIERAVIDNYFENPPAPVSGANGPVASLAAQLGVSRDRINRAHVRAIHRLQLAIMASGLFETD